MIVGITILLNARLYYFIISRLDSMMRRENRKIVLLADNATSHKTGETIAKLTNVRIYFLPPNTTSVLQPLDQGIIHNLKVCNFTFKL